MNSAIAEHTSDTSAAFQRALATLNSARTTYQTGAGAQYAQALARKADLQAKMAAAQAETEAAQAEFQQTLAAAGYERTEAVRAVLARLGGEHAMIEAWRAAIAQCDQAMPQFAIDASVQGRQYADAYRIAYGVFVDGQVSEAMQEAGGTIARAMALLASVPRAHSIQEDSRGLPAANAQQQAEIEASRWQPILNQLATLAKHAQPERAETVLGAFDLGAGVLLSPGQQHALQRSAKAVQ